MSIQVDRLVDAFSDCVGRERACTVVRDVCEEMDYESDVCDEKDAIEIARQVANQPNTTPFVRTAAQTVQTRIQAGHV